MASRGANYGLSAQVANKVSSRSCPTLSTVSAVSPTNTISTAAIVIVIDIAGIRWCHQSLAHSS